MDVCVGVCVYYTHMHTQAHTHAPHAYVYTQHTTPMHTYINSTPLLLPLSSHTCHSLWLIVSNLTLHWSEDGPFRLARDTKL